jgi:hypothetical protein
LPYSTVPESRTPVDISNALLPVRTTVAPISEARMHCSDIHGPIRAVALTRGKSGATIESFSEQSLAAQSTRTRHTAGIRDSGQAQEEAELGTHQ